MNAGIGHLDLRAKTLAARAWIDEHSGEYTWRLLEVVDDGVLSGFRYDGEGFFAPRFKSFDDHYAETWLRLARRQARGE